MQYILKVPCKRQGTFNKCNYYIGYSAFIIKYNLDSYMDSLYKSLSAYTGYALFLVSAIVISTLVF